MTNHAKPLSKTAQAKDVAAALDRTEGWESGSQSTPIPESLIKTIGNVVDIPLASIVEDHKLQQYGLEFNPEANPKQKGLLESIKKHGVLLPICVKEISPGQYRIIYGHKRVICSRTLKYKTIKAIVADPKVDDNILHIIENLFRTEPSTYSNALAGKKLLETEIRPGVRYNRDDVAGYFSWTRDWLDQLLDILDAPAPLVEFFKAGNDPKVIRPVWVQIRKSGKSPQEQESVCAKLLDMGIHSLEPFVSFSRDKHMSITDAVEKIDAARKSGSLAADSTPSPLKKQVGRPTGTRGLSKKSTAKLHLWDPKWLQINSDEATNILVRTTGISTSKADSLVVDHAAGTGFSLGLVILAASAMANPQPSAKAMDEKTALEFAKKLYSATGKKLAEQYLLVVSMLPDMMDKLHGTDKPLYDYAKRAFGINYSVGRGKNGKKPK